MFVGTVKKWIPERGFGFIKRDDGADDSFIHARTVQEAGLQELTVGQRVEFDVQPDPRNPDRHRAVNIRLA